MKLILPLIALALAAHPLLAAAIYSPADYGAVLNGAANDGAALQRAIDAAHAAGGGTVVVPSGRTLQSGSIELKSNVVLDLEPGSRLVASTLPSDYPESIFIRARHAENIAIKGSGTIDGRGLEFLGKEGPYIYEKKDWRPRLILLEDCHHVLVSGVNLREAAFWSLHLAGCEDVSIHGISIRNSLKAPNCDGIDPDHSRNVRITDCSVECGDDAIVIKTSREFAKYGPCENIVVSGCVLTTHDCALKIGSETVDPIRNIVFSDCVVNQCNRGIGIMLRDEGDVENIVAHDIVIRSQLFYPEWWGASEAIYVDAHPRIPGGKLGRLRELRFSHIVSHAEAGVFIRGSAECVPEDIVLDDVTLDISKTTKWPSRIDLRPPEELGVEEKAILIAGIDLQDARQVTLRDCTVRWGPNPPASYGPALRKVRVDGLQVENLQGADAHQP
ncbi:MAG TPA: glycosyl hydrolase family 28 protein [Opitutaceae bacterium]